MDSARTLPFPSSPRRPGLDALRAYATVLVVLLHAALPYTVAPLPGLAWPVRHPSPSAAVDAVFWGIEGLIMPLFFLLSGYGAAQSLVKNPADFLASRWRRLGWPLIWAAAVLLPLELYVWLIGWALDGQIAWVKLRSWKLGPYHAGLWGLSHLWYLEYLLIFSVILQAAQRFVPPAIQSIWRALFAQRLFLLVMGAGVLWLAPEVIVGFQHGFLPFPAKFAFSGLFFAAGAAASKVPAAGHARPLSLALSPEAGARGQDNSVGRLMIHVALGLCGFLLFGLLPLIHRQAVQPLAGWDRILLAVGLAAYAVMATRAVWDWAWSFTGTISPRVERLAQASFWIYLVHHPLVAIGQIALRPTGWPALLQCVLVTLGTLAISLASYEWLVRGTAIGALLEGTARWNPARPMEVPAVPDRRAA